MNHKDQSVATDIATLLKECYSRVPPIDDGIVTVEALVDCLYNTLDPNLTAPVEIQRLALERLDFLATEFCLKCDGHCYRIFDDECFYWSGKWTKSERVPYHIRTWVAKNLYAN